jgi:hypothetical protein
MDKKLLGIISVDFDATGQLLITYSVFDKYVRKHGNTMKQGNRYLYNKAYDSVRWGVLYNILKEFGILMKLVRLIKVCLTEIAVSG